MYHSFLSRRFGFPRLGPPARVFCAPAPVLCGGMLALALSASLLVRAHAYGSWLLGLLGVGLAIFASWTLAELALGRLRELQSARRVRRALSAAARSRPLRRLPQRPRVSAASRPVLRERPRESGIYAFTPYPFSVWSFHDQVQPGEVECAREVERYPRVPAWLWTGVVVGIVLVAVVWLGISVVQLWTAMA